MADIYCYSCNDAKQDPELKSHLAAFGINVGSLTKTEKSMTELVRFSSHFVSTPLFANAHPLVQQIEQNLRYDFSLLSEDGKALEPVFGTGLTGLANLGNSCYMASVLQTAFALPSFKQRYFSACNGSTDSLPHAEACDNQLPADCVECQLVKVADGLLSGRYSHPEDAPVRSSDEARLQHESPTPVFQRGVRPMGFKRLVGKGHEEFATMRQQDAEEFLGWFVSVIRREKKRVEGQGVGGVRLQGMLNPSLRHVRRITDTTGLQIQQRYSATHSSSDCSVTTARRFGIGLTNKTSSASLCLLPSRSPPRTQIL